MRLLLTASLLFTFPALAAMVSKPVAYKAGAAALEGVLIYDDAQKSPRPGLVLVPNWMGINEANLKQAREVAGQKYVVFVADMYGKAVRPKTMDEAGKASGAVKADRKLMRERINKALETLVAQAKTAPVDAGKLAAIGFCFGGTSALELARSGAKVAGVVSFHGGLSSPTPDDAKAIKARVLALHGADDPFTPPEEVKAFEEEMRKAKVDFELDVYGGAVHGFTDPDAKMPGQAMYDPKVSRRAFQRMETFLAEAFTE